MSVLNEFQGKIISSITYDGKYDLQIKFTDDSFITVESAGSEGACLNVLVSCNIRTVL